VKAEPPKSFIDRSVLDDIHKTYGMTYSERTRGVTGSSPLPSSVETEALVSNDSDNTTSTESLWVCLSLDLEDIEWEEDNFTNTNDGSSQGVHHGLASLGAEGGIEGGAMVGGEVIADEWLTTVLVDSLKDLIRCEKWNVKRWPTDFHLLTLYPAAYPRPGNNEKNLVPTGAVALSLKMTWFNWTDPTI
jgi:hypothetical protein